MTIDWKVVIEVQLVALPIELVIASFVIARRAKRNAIRQGYETPPPSQDPVINAGFGPDYPFQKKVRKTK